MYVFRDMFLEKKNRECTLHSHQGMDVVEVVGMDVVEVVGIGLADMADVHIHQPTTA